MEALKILRKQAFLSQQELAEKLGMPKPTYAHYESGRSEPDISTLKSIADFFGCSVDYLVGHQMRDSTQGLTPAQKQLFSDIQKFDEADFMRVEAFVEGIKSAREEERKIRKRFLVDDEEA